MIRKKISIDKLKIALKNKNNSYIGVTIDGLYGVTYRSHILYYIILYAVPLKLVDVNHS